EERGAVTDEYIRIIKTLWSDDPATFEGDYYQFRNLHLAPRPVQQPHPPVWVGGNSRRAVRRAVELGDGWIPFQVTEEELRDRLEYARSLPAYGQRAAPLDVALPAGPVEIKGKPVDGERARLVGSGEQVRDDVRVYQQLGVTGMTAGFRAGSLDEQLEQMERFAREVMPAFA
ncbi:MAG: LLM class flavin-dependent oxidoreductase, partial [Dehalococcoidia bacterium]|nr:LLM class flavin-dependent oxidoreductase [Dehalococcoidia bacterium]